VVVKAIQARAVSQAKAVRAEDKTILRVKAARATLVRETRAKEPRAKGILGKAIPETLVRASQAKATREAAARDSAWEPEIPLKLDLLAFARNETEARLFLSFLEPGFSLFAVAIGHALTACNQWRN
jgi:hypothetical protein